MDYLVYVERSAENLQFYLWLRDYTQRFNALKAEEQALSPPWKDEGRPAPDSLPPRMTKDVSVYEREVDFNNTQPSLQNAASYHSSNKSIVSVSTTDSFLSKSTQAPMTIKSMETITEDANVRAGLKWQACMSLLSPLPQI